MSDAAKTAPAPVVRPELTLPEAEAEWLRAAYEGAEVILEYGSGGSTVMAAEMGGKTVTSVESDRRWAKMMERYFSENPPASDVTIHPVWVGPTARWGMPKTDKAWAKYPNYPLGVWDREGFRQPDVVLIDGRFRVGCLLATLFRTEKPVTVFFDDYTPRADYHVAEDFTPRVETRGRMARFDIEPARIDGRRLLQIAALLHQKQ